MSTPKPHSAVDWSQRRTGVETGTAATHAEKFGRYTFNKHVMAERLSGGVNDRLLDTIENNEPLDAEIANEVAHAMKEWALSHGATHFCHWFQPLRGVTAEQRSYVCQQIHNRAAASGFHRLVAEAQESLFALGEAWLRLDWRTRRESAQLDCTLAGHESWVTAVAVWRSHC